jgi:hypothetical protein
MVPDALLTIVRSYWTNDFGHRVNALWCVLQFLVIADRGKNDNDCNRAALRGHRTVFDMKPSGGFDETWRMVTTALTRVVALSDQSRSKPSGNDRDRYDCDRTIFRDHRTVPSMRSSDRLNGAPRMVPIVFSRVVMVTSGRSGSDRDRRSGQKRLKSRNPSGLPYRPVHDAFGWIGQVIEDGYGLLHAGGSMSDQSGSRSSGRRSGQR